MSEIANLLCILLLEKNWEQAEQHLRLWPYHASHYAYHTLWFGNTIRCLPIHLACMLKPPIQIITAFIAAHNILSTTTHYQDPVLVRSSFTSSHPLLEKDSLGRCALHLACRYNASSEVLNTLMSSCPSCVFVRADDGSLPIHMLCLYAKSYLNTVRALKRMLYIMPSIIYIRDDNDLLPKDLLEDNSNFHDVTKEALRAVLYEAEYDGPTFTEFSESVISYSSSIPWSTNSSMSSSKSDESAELSSTAVKTKKCIICLSNEACRVLLPCGHISLCQDCTTPTKLMKMGHRCPECRTCIHDAITVYARIMADD